MSGYNFHEMKGARTLFVGDVGSGKTRLMAQLIRQELEQGSPERIVVLDLGPNYSFTGKKIGARLELPMSKNLLYLAPKQVRAPRLEGKTKEEVLELAGKNRKEIDELLDSLGTPGILFVNDVTMYFHAGGAERMIKLAIESSTFIANGYKGSSLPEDRGSGVSENERNGLEALGSRMDRVVYL